MSAHVQIRPATPADVKEILAMVTELAEFEKLTHLLDMSAERMTADLFGDKPLIECLIAQDGDNVLAFALYFQSYSTFLTRRSLYLEDLYVRPHARGLGLGKRMLLQLARIAKERGFGRFEWSVLDWNSNAIGFYEGLGATVMPDWRICRVTGDALTRMAERED
ncbi:GNAT family N-acetyltransferase [Silvimonas iriomotensis]|uniref:N-acetyltransferase n=1 Tax=Silvimonas iriomotensis TaxID=449662 RepID=A0ABQ2PFR7_9NEIS|nr:GNAT family N-acetyltransferase [Silvimonas iriomotensis]GGP24100.1 N-acetyltransferase [Silvimonas iriomotensis]